MLTWAGSNLQHTTKHFSHSYFSLGRLVLIMFIKFSFSVLIEEPITLSGHGIIFTLREPNVYKPHGFFLGFLATFICFCVAVLFYRYLYFVVNQIKVSK